MNVVDARRNLQRSTRLGVCDESIVFSATDTRPATAAMLCQSVVNIDLYLFRLVWLARFPAAAETTLSIATTMTDDVAILEGVIVGSVPICGMLAKTVHAGSTIANAIARGVSDS